MRQGSVRFKIVLPTVLLTVGVMFAILVTVFLVTKQVSEDYQNFVMATHAAEVRRIIDTAVNELVAAKIVDRMDVTSATQKSVARELLNYWRANQLDGLVMASGKTILATPGSARVPHLLQHAARTGPFQDYHGLNFVNGHVTDLPVWDWRVVTISRPTFILKRNTSVFLLIPLILVGGLLLAWGLLLILDRNLQRPVRQVITGITQGSLIPPIRVLEVDHIGGAINEAFSALRKRNEQFRMLHDVAVSISRLSSRDEILKTMLEKAAAILGTGHAAIGVFEPAGGRLKTLLKTGNLCQTEVQMETCEAMLDGIRSGLVPRLINDIGSDVPFASLSRGCCIAFTNILACPLTSPKGYADAVLFFGNKADGFDADDERLVRALAADAMTAIDRFRDEGALKQALENLERQNLSLRELDRMKDGLIRDVSHELKTPVAKQAMQLELLRKGLGGQCLGNVEKMLQVMEASVRRQEQVIRNMLDLSRLEAGGRKCHIQPIRVDLVIEKVIEDYRLFMESAAIGLKKSLTELTVEADEEMLWHIFSNLLNNAIKFRRKEGAGQVEVMLTREGDRAVVRIKDDGIGLRPENLSRIFDRFYQASASVEGSGVGLTLCKVMTEQLGGTIALESEGTGKGTTAVVKLILAREAAPG